MKVEVVYCEGLIVILCVGEMLVECDVGDVEMVVIG